MLHTKAQLTFPAWLVKLFSMRLNEENQKEDSVLKIQRLTNTVEPMLLLGLTELRRMIKVYRFTFAAVPPACWLNVLTPHALVQLAIPQNTLSCNLSLSLRYGNFDACMQQGILA